ncbi:MAG TPA: hypothetical protein VIM53_00275 [Candidatus Saccharimonadales bacterium]
MKSHDLRRLDPHALAQLDADMWVAYYNHRFARLAWLLFKLNRSHFAPNVFTMFRAAYHSAMSAIIFRKTKGHEENDKVLKHLILFYKLLSAQNVESFDYRRAAELELAWWMVDRYPERYKTTRAVALAEGMAAIYGVAPEHLRVYGEKRAAAMELLGAYHYDVNTQVDWPKLRHLLEESYEALRSAVQ